MKISKLLEDISEDWMRSSRRGDYNRCSVLSTMEATLQRAQNLGFTELEQFIEMAKQAGNQKHVEFLEKCLKMFEEGTVI